MDLETVLRLIQRQGTLEQVSTFLRGKKVPFSAGTWAEMIGSRLRPALDDGRLANVQLLDLLRQTEEHGSQHVFFFDLVPGRDISRLFDGRLAASLASAGLPVSGAVSVVDMPVLPTVVEVREEFDEERALIFKIVERRAHLEKVSDTSANGRLVITYDEVPYRAVSVMKIVESGRAEIRIQSHSDPIRYGGLSEAVFRLLSPVVDRLDWKDRNLEKFKANLFDVNVRPKLMPYFALRHSQHANSNGTRLTAASGMPNASMYDDHEVVASVDRFLEKKGHSHTERATVTMRAGEALRRSVSLILSGEANELAIASKISKSEYDFIVAKVLEFNQ